MPEQEEQKYLSRRKFLKKTWGMLGIIGAVELGLLSISFLGPAKRGKTIHTATLKTAGMVNDIPNGSVIPFRNGKFYLVRMDDGGFMALSLACSHLGCSVLWNKEEEKFICPCHSSQFDKKGNVLSRPAPRPLDFFKVAIEEGKVMVDTSVAIKRKKFDKKQLVYA